MAKVSGAKNPGAWYRANKLLKSLDGTEKDMLLNILNDLETLENAWNAILSLQSEVGIDVALADGPDSAGAWLENMVADGIPLQIWMGRLSWTTYTLSGPVNARIAEANYQSEIHHFARDLRKAIRRYALGRREVYDVTNTKTLTTGNPGGLPDIDVTR